MNFFCLFTCFAIFASNVISKEYDDDAVERGDAYIDKLLKDMFEDRVEEYDPYEIEDSVIGFNRKVLFVNVSGEAKLHDGYIKGLKTLHRPNHCELQEQDGRLYVKADLGAGTLDFNYSGSVKFMNHGPTITVHGNLAYVEVYLEFTVDAETGKDGKLTKFIIDDMRGMQVWVTGLGPLNWAVNPIISGVTKVFKRFVTHFLENKVKKHIARHISDFQFPVDKIDIVSTVAPQTTSEETVRTEEPKVTESEERTEEPEVTDNEERTEEPEVTDNEELTEEPEVAESEGESGELEP